MDERKKKQQEEKLAVEFVEELQKQFTKPIIENIDKFLDKQKFEEEAKLNFRKTLMITIANSILLKSGARKKEIKNSYKGIIADYNKLK